MRIRTQFVFTFVLLAVVPLAAIVAYSYLSSQAAVRRAVAAEAEGLTAEMQGRMDDVQRDLRARVERVSALPFNRMMDESAEGADDGKRWLMGRMLSELGEAAPLVESFEFVVTPSAEEEALSEQLEHLQHLEHAAPPPPPAPFAQRMVFNIEEILAEVEEGLEEGDIEFDTEEAMEKARAGIEAAAVIAEGFRGLVQVFQSGDDGEGEPPAPLAPPLIAHEEIEQERLLREEAAAHARERFLRERELNIPVRREGLLVGEVKAQVSGGEVLNRVLGRTRRDQGEIPFAMDDGGALYAASDEDRDLLDELPLHADVEVGDSGETPDWVIVTSEDSTSGLTFGIARPIGEPLQEIREAAVRNLGIGLGLIGLALLGIVPLSGRMTRDLKQVTLAAERIAGGDLETEVAVRSRNEIGQLAGSFNRMSRDLRENREKLVAEEARRREQEVRESLLQAEFDRKSQELEGARSFQLSLLPKEVPAHRDYEVAVFMETAAEVGGDYYDFRGEESGALTVAIGDATGHGAVAGTMVTIVKSLFSAYPPGAGLAGFLEEANRAIKRMDLGRMAMALALARLEGRELTLSSAGMPPVLLYRAAGGSVEEIELQGMPLGSLDFAYRETRLTLEPGDAVLLMSDGFPELPNPDGDPLGYDRVHDLFSAAGSKAPDELIAELSRAAVEWAGEGSPNDDITFVALKIRAS